MATVAKKSAEAAEMAKPKLLETYSTAILHACSIIQIRRHVFLDGHSEEDIGKMSLDSL